MSWLYYEILTLQPDFTDPVQAGIHDDRETVGGAGDSFTAWPGRTDRVLNFTFQTMNPAEWRTIREFFDRHGGRAKTFFVPSWQHDFELAADANAGATLIELAGNWHTENVTEARPDTLGRMLFFYNHLGQFSTRWVLGFADGGAGADVLVLDRPLANDLEAGRTMVGFCHLVRLANDTLEAEHLAPGIGRMETAIREVTNTRRVNQQESAAGEAVGALHAAFDIIATDEDPIFTDLRISEAVGPFTYATSQPLNFQSDWVAVLDPAANTVEITGGTLGLTIASLLYNAPAAAIQIALAFDAASREVLAWELDGATTVAWNAAVIQRLTFAGYSPVAYNTFAIDGTVDPGTAALAVFYLKRGDTSIYCRLISENFATEHRYVISPLAPIYLHAARRHEGRVELVGMDAGHRLARWRSQAYLTPRDAEVVAVKLDSFAFTYRAVTVMAEHPGVASASQIEPDSFALTYRAVTVLADPPEPTASTSRIEPDSFAGSYVSVKITGPATERSATIQLDSPMTLSYMLVRALAEPLSTKTITQIGEFTGTYEPAP